MLILYNFNIIYTQCYNIIKKYCLKKLFKTNGSCFLFLFSGNEFSWRYIFFNKSNLTVYRNFVTNILSYRFVKKKLFQLRGLRTLVIIFWNMDNSQFISCTGGSLKILYSKSPIHSTVNFEKRNWQKHNLLCATYASPPPLK